MRGTIAPYTTAKGATTALGKALAVELGPHGIRTNIIAPGMYETEFKIRMIRAEERLKAVAADAETAKLLGIKQGTPLLRIERVSYTYGDVPMEWRLGLCITDDHHYMNELE